MAKKSRRSSLARFSSRPYKTILAEVVDLLEASRRFSARAVNAVITTTYWQIGRRIIEGEQGGASRAGYGEQLLERLSRDLTNRFGRGFSVDNLESMRRFYLAYPAGNISETPSRKLLSTNSETLSRKSLDIAHSTSSHIFKASSQSIVVAFPLPWSHYVRLLSVENPLGRRFYETEALRGGWTVKQLNRQIDTQFYERTALSRNKAAMLTKHSKRRREDDITAEEQLKDPFLLEFLGLKDEYSNRLPNKIMAAKYRTVLPDERRIAAELEKTRRLLQSRPSRRRSLMQQETAGRSGANHR